MSLRDVWQKLFDTFVWYNFPSTSSPVNAANLNKMNTAIDGIDDRVLELKTGLDGVTEDLEDKVDKEQGKGLSTNDYDNTAKGIVDGVTSALDDKVDKEQGKGLSTEDFTTEEKTKLAGISSQANKVEITPVVTEGTTLATVTIDGVNTDIKGSDIEVDDELKPDSTNPVQNKVIYETLQSILPEETAEGNPISISDASGLNAKSCEIAFSPVQSGSGDPSPENVRPISGWTELNVARYGINLATTIIYKQGYVLNSDGTETVSTNYCITEKVPVNGGSKYILRFKENSGELSDNAIRIGFYKADGTFKSRSVLINGRPAITIENDVAFLCFSYVNVSTSANYKWDLMFNEGETPLDYVPYQGTTHTATLGSTYYGGKLDMVSGKLTIDKAIVDLGSLEWTYNTSFANPIFYAPLLTKVNDRANTGVCSCYPVNPANVTGAQNASSTLNDNEIALSINTVSYQLFIRDETYSSKETLTEFLNGKTLVYELATPTEITLSAEQIALLKGQNVLWTDGNGNITLVYSCDIKAWVEAQLQS